MEHKFTTPQLLQQQLSDFSTTPEQASFHPVRLQLNLKPQGPTAHFSTSTLKILVANAVRDNSIFCDLAPTDNTVG